MLIKTLKIPARINSCVLCISYSSMHQNGKLERMQLQSILSDTMNIIHFAGLATDHLMVLCHDELLEAILFDSSLEC